MLLVRLNFKGLGVKIYRALQNPKTAPRIYAKWCNLGGAGSLLRSTATKAYNKAKRRGKVSGDFDIENTIGVAPAVLLAQAKIVLKAILPILKMLKSRIQEQQQNEQETQQTDD